jgi:hypothetical protein
VTASQSVDDGVPIAQAGQGRQEAAVVAEPEPLRAAGSGQSKRAPSRGLGSLQSPLGRRIGPTVEQVTWQ